MKKFYCLLFSFSFLIMLNAQPTINLVQVGTGFSRPVDIKNCGDGRIFIVEKVGRIKIMSKTGVVNSTPFLDITTRVQSSGNEQGLLGLAFSPNFKQDGYFYVNYINGSGAPIQNYFRQMQDTNLAICGAHLQKLDSVYYLVFGHRFDGYYDRSDTTGFHVQIYSNEIRKFQIADDGVNLSLYNYHAVRDTANFRRRDYNLIPFYNPWKGNGLLAYSGVFRKGIDLPYFNLVEIYPDTFIVRNDFNQTLSQYHSAVCPLYDSINAINHDVFFGGMSMYYVDSVGATVTDSMVPFVRTISDVARDVDENYHELNAGITMPALLGTNAYFFMDAAVPTYKSFVHVNKLGNHTRIGYICGGIESPDMNINSTDPSLSFASARVFEVYTNKATGFGKEVVNDVLDFYCYPNPATRQSEVCFELSKAQIVNVSLFDVNGRLVTEVCNKEFAAGKQKLLLNMSDYPKGVYNVAITVNNRLKSIRLVHQ